MFGFGIANGRTTLVVVAALLVFGETSLAAWESLGPDSPADVYSLAVDPGDSEVVYAGTSWGGVYRSSDGGTTWAPMRDGLPRRIDDLEIAPDQPTTLYASGGYESEGLFRTTDAGTSWQPTEAPDGIAYVYDAATDPGNGATLYAAGYGRILKSTDRAQTWTEVFIGLDTHDDVERFCSVIVDPVEADTVYATSSFGAVVRTRDAGATWERFPGIFGGCGYVDPATLGAAASSPGTLYLLTSSELLRSEDGGETWALRSVVPGRAHALAIDPRRADDVYVVTHDALLKSGDGGISWSSPPGAGSILFAHALAISPTNPDVIYAGTPRGVFRSRDAGETWSGSFTGMHGVFAFALALDPAAPQKLYTVEEGGRQDGHLHDYSLLRKSKDGGTSWKVSGSGLEEAHVADVAVDPGRSNVLYAGRFSSGASGGGVAKSTNGGRTFRSASAGLPVIESSSGPRMASVTKLAIDPDETDTVYAATWGGGFYVTSDGAQSWSALNEGLPSLLSVSLALDPATKTLYAGVRGSSRGGSQQAFLRRRPADSQWTVIETDFGATPSDDGEVFAIAIDPSDADTLYVGTASAGVFKTTDGGVTWNPASAGLPCRVFRTDCPYSIVNRLVVDPARTATVFAETQDGVFQSDDGGASWRDISDGLFPGRIRDSSVGTLGLDSSGFGAIYVGTQGGGAYRHRLPCEESVLLQPRVEITNPGDPSGNQRIVVSGVVELGGDRRVAPASIGVRAQIEGENGAALLDVNLRGGDGWRDLERAFQRRPEDIPNHGRWRARVRQSGDRVKFRLVSEPLPIEEPGEQRPLSLRIGFATDAGDRVCAAASLTARFARK